MTRKQRERAEFRTRIRDVVRNQHVQKMKEYPQHGSTNTLLHCIRVARLSFWLSKRLPCHFHTQSLLRGALLHDFYLYDWHKPEEAQPLHGFRHPSTALKNARRYFRLNPVEENVIISHMWPLTLRQIPRSREAAVVCLADKLCSLHETVAGWIENKPKKIHKL